MTAGLVNWPAFCRDCLSDAKVDQPCSSCGSTRVVAHPELDRLTIAHVRCNAFYAAKQGATIRLHGTATIGGKAYNYDYFGYLIPSWTGVGTQPDTILGTVLRSDPANAANAPLIASFSATREVAK